MPDARVGEENHEDAKATKKATKVILRRLLFVFFVTVFVPSCTS
jgi:hypothetical protein